MSKGKSKSHENRNGIRSRAFGKELAPRSMRRRGKTYLSECSDEELEKYSNVSRN